MIKIFISILSFALLFDLCWCQNVRKGWKSKITMLVFICFRLLLRVLLHFLVSLSTYPAWRRGHLQKPEHWEREMVIAQESCQARGGQCCHAGEGNECAPSGEKPNMNVKGKPVCNPTRCCQAGCAESRTQSLCVHRSINPKLSYLCVNE